MRHPRRRLVRRATAKLTRNGAYASLAAPLAVVAQLLVGDEDDRSLGLRASTDGKTRTLHAHEHVRSAHDVVVVRPQSPLLLLRTLSIKAAACLMMMWVRSSRTQMMTRKIMRHKVTYTVKVHGQGGASTSSISF